MTHTTRSHVAVHAMLNRPRKTGEENTKTSRKKPGTCDPILLYCTAAAVPHVVEAHQCWVRAGCTRCATAVRPFPSLPAAPALSSVAVVVLSDAAGGIDIDANLGLAPS